MRGRHAGASGDCEHGGQHRALWYTHTAEHTGYSRIGHHGGAAGRFSRVSLTEGGARFVITHEPADAPSADDGPKRPNLVWR